MPAAGDILIANGLALAAQGGGVGYKGIIRQDSDDPIWEMYLNTDDAAQQSWTKSAYAGRILRARFSPGDASESGVVMAAISPLNAPWTLRAHLLFGVSSLTTVESRVVTTWIHQWQGHILAEFQQLDAVWTAVTPPAAVTVPASPHDSTSWSSAVAYTALGSAPIAPTITVDTGAPSSGSAPNRYSFTLTNNLDYPVVKHPWLVHLGSTTGWSGSTEANTYLFCDGLEVPRELIALGEARSYVLFTIDRIAPGQTKTYELLTGGTVAALSTAPQDLTGKQRSPVADFGWQVITATSGGTNVVTMTGMSTGTDYASAPTNRWKHGAIFGLTSPVAGQAWAVTASNATTITAAGSFSAFTAGTKFLVLASYLNLTGEYLSLNWAVRQTEHSDAPHGLLYTDRAQNAPKSVTEDSPLSWQRARTWDNNDDVAAPQVTAINVGTTDYFSIPNISRTWQGGDDNSSVKERGTADAYVYSSPFPIDAWTLDYAWKNPNGVAKAVIGSRQSQQEDWTLHVENTTAYSTLTDIAEQTISPPSGTYHLLFGVWPRLGDEIPTSWRRDSGGRTGGGSTTFTDDSKDWTADQWIGARLRITAGKAQGNSWVVEDNDPNTLSFPSDPIGDVKDIPNDGSRYEVVQKPLIANLQSDDVWRVNLHVVGIAVSSLTSHGAAERVSLRIRANGGASATTDHVYLDIGVTRSLWVSSGHTVVIDADAHTASVMNGSTFVKDVTDWVRAYESLTDTPVPGALYVGQTPAWLPIQPGAGNFYVQRVAGAATFDVDVVLRAGYLG